jgi:hypothetical protein
LVFLGVVTRLKVLVIQMKNGVVHSALERPQGWSQYVLR